MSYLNVEALQESEKERGSEWIKIGVDTGAGKTAWPQIITYGTMIPGDSDLTFRTATGELVKGKIRHEERSREVWVHGRMSCMHAVGVRHAQCEGSS